MKRSIGMGLILAGTAALVACGGGGGSHGGSANGDLKLSITDAPVDDAKHVWITITGVKLKKTGQDEEKVVAVTGNELTVDLLSLSNGLSTALFTETLSAGEYQWARFQLKDNARIVWIDDSENALELPSQDELKTSGNFSVPANGLAQYTVDWDLRKSVVETGNGKFKLKPVLHLKDDDQVGFVTGSLDSTFLADNCDQPEDITGIYLYTGHAIEPGEMGGSGVEPVASVKMDSDDNSFYLGMLNPGNYTLAVTCDAGIDTPEQDAPGVTIEFPAKAEITVSAGEETELEDVHFPFLALPDAI